jgi:hypothetical protein
MATFVTALQQLEAFGLSDVLLPFILIFAVVFAILGTVKIFGDKGKNINIIVALSMALLVVVPHVTGSYPAGGDVVEIMNHSIPNVSAVIIAIVMMMILIGAFGVRFNLAGKKLGGVVAIVALMIVIYIFGRSAGWYSFGSWPSWLSFLNDSDTLMVIVVLLVFGLMVAFITHDPLSDEEKANKKSKGDIFKEWIGDVLEKPPEK